MTALPYSASIQKRGEVDEQFGILTFFIGILVHDHFVSYYQFENASHSECNEHILRYLKGLLEIFKHDWLKDMDELLKSACHRKNELVAASATQMPREPRDGSPGFQKPETTRTVPLVTWSPLVTFRNHTRAFWRPYVQYEYRTCLQQENVKTTLLRVIRGIK